MKVRLMAEVEISDERLLAQFGAQLAALTPVEIPAGLSRATEALLLQVPHVTRAKVIYIPELLP